MMMILFFFFKPRTCMGSSVRMPVIYFWDIIMLPELG